MGILRKMVEPSHSSDLNASGQSGYHGHAESKGGARRRDQINGPTKIAGVEGSNGGREGMEQRVKGRKLEPSKVEM